MSDNGEDGNVNLGRPYRSKRSNIYKAEILYYKFSPIQVGSTPLYQASFMGDTDEVKELLEGGADVNEQNDVSLSES